MKLRILRPVPPEDARSALADVVHVDPTQRLVHRCRTGDERAWAELYHQEAPRITRFLRRLLGPERESDDAVQQVFVELFTSLPRFRGDAKLTTWIYRIACNVAGKRLRSERRRLRRMAALFDWIDGDGADSSPPRPDRQVIARDELRRLASAVDELPVGQRLVWVLREVEDLSTEEVAAALDLSPGTVRSRLHHARKRVAKRTGLDPATEERER